jgi:hypothetical protein
LPYVIIGSVHTRSLPAQCRGVHSHLRFENPALLPHHVVLEAMARAIEDRSQEAARADALVGIALNDADREFIERCCLDVGARAEAGSPLLGLAGLCLGHAARRFGYLSDQPVTLAQSLATRAQADPSDVDGRALDGLDDIRFYLRRDDAGQNGSGEVGPGDGPA